MPSFSDKSKYQLSTCDVRLQILFNEVINHHDCTVIQGYRSPEDQLAMFNARPQLSKVASDGDHNVSPSRAVDVAPFIPGRNIPWPVVGSETYVKDLQQFYYFAGIVIGISKMMDIPVANGSDWSRDNDLSDQTFMDLPHYFLY